MTGNEKQRLKAGNFVRNNGRVLRTINILRHKYNKLSGIQNVLENDGISQDEFLDAVNFLDLEGYIDLRDVATKAPASLADNHFETLEFNALVNTTEEDWKGIKVDKMMKEATGLIRAAAYKKRVEVQNQDAMEAGLDAVRTLVFQAMAKERPDLYAEVTKFLAAKKAAGLEQE